MSPLVLGQEVLVLELLVAVAAGEYPLALGLLRLCGLAYLSVSVSYVCIINTFERASLLFTSGPAHRNDGSLPHHSAICDQQSMHCY